MMKRYRDEAGFSAAELLVTLFVAAIFVLLGYQLYSSIMKDNAASQSRARASNIAYDIMRQYSVAPSSCTNGVARQDTPSAPTDNGLSNPVITVTRSIPQGNCPYQNNIMLVKVNVTYDNTDGSQSDVNHAEYIYVK